jgi:hypothetical protein
LVNWPSSDWNDAAVPLPAAFDEALLAGSPMSDEVELETCMKNGLLCEVELRGLFRDPAVCASQCLGKASKSRGFAPYFHRFTIQVFASVANWQNLTSAFHFSTFAV